MSEQIIELSDLLENEQLNKRAEEIEKLNWTNGYGEPLDAENLNLITDSISDNSKLIRAVNDTLAELKDKDLKLDEDLQGEIVARKDANTDLQTQINEIKTEVYNQIINKDDDTLLTSFEDKKPNSGDILVVTAQHRNDELTAYIWNENIGVDGNWQALSGNYNASTVYLNKSITVAGNFTTIGNYEKGKTTIAAGTSIESLLSGMLQQELEPAKTSSPSASISASGGSGEVGTTFSAPTAKLTIGGIGSYTYGPATGITFAAGDVKLAEGQNPSTASNCKINSSVMVKDNYIELEATSGGMYGDNPITYTFSGTASYTVPAEGFIPVTNLGNERPGVKFTSGPVTVVNKTISFKGYRKWFIGGDSQADFSSSTIRSLSNCDRQNGTFEMKAANYKDCKRILIAIPTAEMKNISEVLLKSASNANITTEFKKINSENNPIFIEGANSYTEVEYDVWEYRPASLDSSEVYTITIANAQ